MSTDALQSVTTTDIKLDAWYRGPSVSYSREPLVERSGAQRGSLGMTPRLLTTRVMRRLATVQPLPLSDRVEALGKAADLFEQGAPGGESRHSYINALTEVSGVPPDVAEASIGGVAAALRTVTHRLDAARPAGTVLEVEQGDRPARGGGLWERRGRTFAVIASGNTPGVHSLWPEALALGFGVAVRPSRREPFTPHRLVRASAEAGLEEHVAFVPCTYDVADHLVDAADLSLVYGGQDVVDKYAGDSRVLTQGPGRSKIVIGADVDWREHVDVLRQSVAAMGGAACTCTTAVLAEQDHKQVAEALATALNASGNAATGPLCNEPQLMESLSCTGGRPKEPAPF